MNHPRPLNTPSHAAIAARAYELWQRRGCPQDSAEQDWIEAEAQLRREAAAQVVAVQVAPLPVLTPVTAPAQAQAAPKRARRTRATTAAAMTAAPATAAVAPSATGTRVRRKRPAQPDA